MSFASSIDTVLLPKYDLDKDFSLTTVFQPDSMAIDTFKTALEQVEVDIKKVEKEVIKSAFSLYPLPGDYSEKHTTTSTVDLIWTNANAITESPTYISKVSGHVLPQWFTIDLGTEYELTKMKLFQRGNSAGNANRLYAGGNLMEFEVWGSLNPDPNYNPDDHGGNFGDSWVLLKSCTVNRPSVNTIAATATRSDNSQADIDAAVAGHEFAFNNAGKIRYVRIKALKNWDYAGRSYVNIAAVAFWAMQY